MQTNSSEADSRTVVEPVQSARGGPGELPVDADYARLLAMITALTAELSVVRERLDTCERLAERAGIFTRSDIDGFEPDAQEMTDRADLRRRLLAAVFRPIEQELQLALAKDDTQ